MTGVHRQVAERVAIPKAEVFRYLGYGKSKPDIAAMALIDTCLAEFEALADYRACYIEVGVTVTGDTVTLGQMTLHSASLAKTLSGCCGAILFAATIGQRADAARVRAELKSPARAVVLDAIGTAAVETWCDALCVDFSRACNARGLAVRPRFSPGYGDLALEAQRPLLALLDAPRQAGITLTNALLMTPRKSVSAIVGIGREGCTALRTGCQSCQKVNCRFRLS